MFDTEKMGMTDWSKKVSKKGLPRQWQTMPTKVLSILFDPHSKDAMILQSHDMFVLLDTTKVYKRFRSTFPPSFRVQIFPSCQQFLSTLKYIRT